MPSRGRVEWAGPRRRGPAALVAVLATVAAAAAALVGPAASAGPMMMEPPPRHPVVRAVPLGHAGRYLTAATGQVAILHGLNMVSKVVPYEPAAAGFGATAARSLAANGFDVVRLGVIYAALEPRPGVFSAGYLASIKRTVATLAGAGVYTLLDFHQDQLSVGFGGEGFPAWSVETGGLPVRASTFPSGYLSNGALAVAFDNFWADRPGPGGVGLQQRYAQAWRYVAARFAGDPSVLGYDLFNEPWPANATDTQLGAFYSRVISAIRAVDPTHLIFYEPYLLFDFGQQTTLPPFSDRKLGLSFHDYCLGNAVSQAAECARVEAQPVRNALERARATGSALVETEFGATDDLADLARVEGIADAYGISWIEWAYCGCDDPTGSVPPSIEGLVADPSRSATGANVDAAKLAVLGEPYPRLTSGTPERYSFDHATRTMRYRYSTIGPDRKRFGAGSCTAIVVPPAQYPSGYRVNVAGARVTSAPGAGVLTLAQSGTSAHRSTVSVEIDPVAVGHTSVPQPRAIAACT